VNHKTRSRALAAWTAALVVAACGGSASTGTESPDGGATGDSSLATGGAGGSGGTVHSAGTGGGVAGSSAAGSGGASASDASSGSGGSGGAVVDGSPATCDSDFRNALVKDCQSETDCVLLNHNDCCGTVVFAVKKGTEAIFAAAQATYHSCVPGCDGRGCFHADMAEDLKPATSPSQVITAICDNNMCTSTFR
jgi:hypothetical protein